jgi:hypothetical protein
VLPPVPAQPFTVARHQNNRRTLRSMVPGVAASSTAPGTPRFGLSAIGYRLSAIRYSDGARNSAVLGPITDS